MKVIFFSPRTSLAALLKWGTLLLFCFPAFTATAALSMTPVPQVGPSLVDLDLSRPPSDRELMAAGQLGGQLYPTHSLANQARAREINLDFGRAIQAWNHHEYPQAVEMFREHVRKYPDSPWASEAVLHVGCDAYYNGRYSEADRCFQEILQANQLRDHAGALALMMKARLRLANLRTAQGNFPAALKQLRLLKQQSPNWRDRTYASHWIVTLSRYQHHQQAMLNCGVRALACLLRREGKPAAAKKVESMLPDSRRGFSLQDLKSIAGAHGYHLTGLKLTPAQLLKVPLPAIVQLSGRHKGDTGHYWLLEGVRAGRLNFFDPQEQRRMQQSTQEFSREWDGKALVLANRGNLPGEQLAAREMSGLYGGCCGQVRPEDHLGPPQPPTPGPDPGPDDNDNDNPCGAPVWKVNRINMNFYVADTPLWHRSPIGPPVNITLCYNSQSATENFEYFGPKWQFNYGTYLVEDSGYTVTLFLPGGRREVFTPVNAGATATDYTCVDPVSYTLVKLAAADFQLTFENGTIYSFLRPQLPNGMTGSSPLLAAIVDAHGQQLTFGYDLSPGLAGYIRLRTITDALGRVTTLNYNNTNPMVVTSVADPFGRSASFDYDAKGNLSKITDMSGYWTSFTYDADLYINSMTNARGSIWSIYTEPADGIINNSNDYPPPGGAMWEDFRVTVTDPLGHKEEYQYDGDVVNSWHVTPNCYVNYVDSTTNNWQTAIKTTVYEFDGLGNVASIFFNVAGSVNFSGARKEFDASSNGLINCEVITPDLHTPPWGYSYWYDPSFLNQVSRLADPNGNFTQYGYTAWGDGVHADLTSVTDGLGTVSLGYNSTHDIASITDRLGNKNTFAYNTYGQLTSQTDPLGVVTNYYYDAGHHLTSVRKAGQTLCSFTYDSLDRVSTYTDAAGLTLGLTYNNLDQVTEVTYPDGKFTTTTYSSCCPHLVDSYTDRAGRTTFYSYDALSRLTSVTGSDGGTTRFAYDANGNLTSRTDTLGNVTRFEYDAKNCLTKKVYANGTYELYTYNNLGQMLSQTNGRGATTYYDYDKNNLVRSYGNSEDFTEYNHDTYNRLIKIDSGQPALDPLEPHKYQDHVLSCQFAYDANSRLAGITGPWGEVSAYQYDALGRRTGLTINGNPAAAYTYDGFGRLVTVSAGGATYTYGYSGANPLVQTLTRPNGTVCRYAYNGLQQLTQVSNETAAGAVIDRHFYAYDGQDLRATETVTGLILRPAYSNALATDTYNNLNQLVSRADPGQKTFRYDADGNLVGGYTPQGYPFAAAYDAENRLASLSYTDGSGVSNQTDYHYVGSLLAGITKLQMVSGNQVSRSETRLVHDGLQVVQERDATGAVLREYIRGPGGSLVQLNEGGTPYSYLDDGQGNVAALLDGSSAVADSYRYDPFGLLMVKNETVPQPMKFAGKFSDDQTGLVYFGFRFYAPTLGRWLNRDPAGEAGGANLYATANNPVNFLDPWGLAPEDGDISWGAFWNTLSRRDTWVSDQTAWAFSHPLTTMSMGIQGFKSDIWNMFQEKLDDSAYGTAKSVWNFWKDAKQTIEIRKCGDQYTNNPFRVALQGGDIDTAMQTYNNMTQQAVQNGGEAAGRAVAEYYNDVNGMMEKGFNNMGVPTEALHPADAAKEAAQNYAKGQIKSWWNK